MTSDRDPHGIAAGLRWLADAYEAGKLDHVEFELDAEPAGQPTDTRRPMRNVTRIRAVHRPDPERLGYATDWTHPNWRGSTTTDGQPELPAAPV